MPHLRLSSRTVRVRRKDLETWKREQVALAYTGNRSAPVTWPHTIPVPGAWPVVPIPRQGGVYVIQIGDDGPLKVGVSQDVAARIASLQTASPYELRFLGLIGRDATDESKHHEALRSEHVRGEWFANTFRTRLYLAPLLGLVAEVGR